MHCFCTRSTNFVSLLADHQLFIFYFLGFVPENISNRFALSINFLLLSFQDQNPATTSWDLRVRTEFRRFRLTEERTGTEIRRTMTICYRLLFFFSLWFVTGFYLNFSVMICYIFVYWNDPRYLWFFSMSQNCMHMQVVTN